MKKTRMCYYFSVMISILLGGLFLILIYRQCQGFEYPTESNLNLFLQSCKYPLLIGFVISTFLSITIKCIIDDLEWKLADLENNKDNLKKNNTTS